MKKRRLELLRNVVKHNIKKVRLKKIHIPKRVSNILFRLLNYLFKTSLLHSL